MRTVLLIVTLVFAACGDGSTDEQKEAVYEDRETVFDPMVGTIDKAKQVEQQVLEQKVKIDEALEDIEGDQ